MTNQDIIGDLSEKQLNTIPHIIASRTMSEAAEKAGISRNTLYVWLKMPNFSAELQRQRDFVFEQSMEKLKNNCFKAIGTLEALLDNPDANFTYKRIVANDIISYTMKAHDKSKIERLEKKISELEKQLSDRTGQTKTKQE